MVHLGALLLVQEAFKVSITCRDASLSVHAVTMLLSVSKQVAALKHSSGVTALLLTDITVVGEAEKHHNAEEQDKVALARVVKSVWLVPVWETSGVLVGQRCLLSNNRWTISSERQARMLLDVKAQLTPSD